MSGSTPSPCVVDTNVPIIASGRSNAGPECVAACARAVHDTIDSGHIVVDEGGQIVQEYRNHLRASGQPGIGDAFLRWLLTNLWNSERCSQLTITPKAQDPEDFEEFPDCAALSDFDRDDRKFVAVAVAHPENPPILQGLDVKWWGWRNALGKAGIVVTFVCQEDVRRRFEEKRRKR